MEGRILSAQDLLRQALAAADPAALYFRVFANGRLSAPYATLDPQGGHADLASKPLKMKQKELFRFFAKVWTAVVKFLRAQAAKRRPINSVYFGKFLPHSDATGLYAYLPASKFLADNALVYSEVDQFNLNPYSSQVGSHALITHQVPDRLATVSSSAIAAVCSSTKEVVRYVLGEIMAALPRLTAAHPNAHIKIDIGIGSLSIQNGSLRFENPKTEGPTPERKIENGGGVAMAVPLPASNALSVPQTYREIAMKRSLSPSKSAAQKVSQYRSLMNEKASSTHLSRVSVSTPQTRRTQQSRQQKLAQRNKQIYAQLSQRGATSHLKRRHDSLDPTHEYMSVGSRPGGVPSDTSLPLINRYSSSQLGERSPDYTLNHVESSPSGYPRFLEADRHKPYRLLKEEHVAPTTEQAYQRYQSEIAKNKEARAEESRQFKRDIQHSEKFLNNVRIMRLKAQKENESYVKLQRAFKESLQQAERKEQLAKPMRTHFGPEETEEVKLALDSLGAQKKQKFKSDILRQIEEGKRASNRQKQMQQSEDRDFAKLALQSMRTEMQFLEDRKKRENLLLAEAWDKQRQLKAQERAAKVLSKI